MLEGCQRNLKGLVKDIILGLFKTKHALGSFLRKIKPNKDKLD
jgi:hypothetical protein